VTEGKIEPKGNALLIYRLPNERSMTGYTVIRREVTIPVLSAKQKPILYRILALFIKEILNEFWRKARAEMLEPDMIGIRIIPGVYVTDMAKAKRFYELARKMFRSCPKEVRQMYLEFLRKAVNEYIRKAKEPVYKEVIEKDILPTLEREILDNDDIINVLNNLGYHTTYTVAYVPFVPTLELFLPVLDNFVGEITATEVQMKELIKRLKQTQDEEEKNRIRKELNTLANAWINTVIDLIQFFCWFQKQKEEVYKSMYRSLIDELAFRYPQMYGVLKRFKERVLPKLEGEADEYLIQAKTACPKFNEILDELLNVLKPSEESTEELI